jgi:hypothetical protein
LIRGKLESGATTVVVCERGIPGPRVRRIPVRTLGPYCVAFAAFTLVTSRETLGSSQCDFWQTFGNGTDIVSALTVYNGNLFAAVGSTVLQWDGVTWATVGQGFTGGVSALMTYNGELVAGGSFTQGPNGSTYNNIARWNGTSWQQCANGLDGNVYALTVFNGQRNR